MPWQALIWLVAFVLQSGVLGVSMYQLVLLTDLENDLINPHEASKSFNQLVYPEYILQFAVTAFLIITGKWFAASLQVAMLAYNVLQVRRGRHTLDVTEIFRQIKPRRQILTAKMVFNVLVFVLVVYRFVEVIIVSLIAPSGHQAARTLLKEAAASLHR